MLSRRTTRRLGLLFAGAVSIASGLALAWAAVVPATVRAVPTSGLLLIVAMVALPLLLLAAAGAMSGDAATAPGAADDSRPPAHGAVRHEHPGGDRRERPHFPRPARPRAAHRAVEHHDGAAEV
jgi:hypothetical protein